MGVVLLPFPVVGVLPWSLFLLLAPFPPPPAAWVRLALLAVRPRVRWVGLPPLLVSARPLPPRCSPASGRAACLPFAVVALSGLRVVLLGSRCPFCPLPCPPLCVRVRPWSRLALRPLCAPPLLAAVFGRFGPLLFPRPLVVVPRSRCGLRLVPVAALSPPSSRAVGRFLLVRALRLRCRCSARASLPAPGPLLAALLPFALLLLLVVGFRFGGLLWPLPAFSAACLACAPRSRPPLVAVSGLGCLCRVGLLAFLRPLSPAPCFPRSLLLSASSACFSPRWSLRRPVHRHLHQSRSFRRARPLTAAARQPSIHSGSPVARRVRRAPACPGRLLDSSAARSRVEGRATARPLGK